MEWYLKPWKKYVDFSGRARRKEFWTFSLINWVIGAIIGTIAGTGMTAGITAGMNAAAGGAAGMTPGVAAGIGIWMIIAWIFSLVILLPSLAVTVRRLHDTNRNGWLILINLIPIVGWIIVLVWMFLDSNQGENDYGPDPKAEG